jgi:PAS domain S-box-containing protein
MKAVVDFDGYFVWVNLQLRALLGWSVPELTSVPYWELIHPDDQDRAVELTEQTLLSGPGCLTDLEVRMLSRAGTYRVLRWNAESAPHDQRVYWIGIDVAQADSGEAAARVLVGSWDWDIVSDVATWSPGMFEIYGVRPTPPHELKAAVARIHADDRAGVERAIRYSLATGEPYFADHRIVRPDDDIRWLHSAGRVLRDAHGNPERMRGLTWDVTARMRARPRRR